VTGLGGGLSACGGAGSGGGGRWQATRTWQISSRAKKRTICMAAAFNVRKGRPVCIKTAPRENPRPGGERECSGAAGGGTAAGRGGAQLRLERDHGGVQLLKQLARDTQLTAFASQHLHARGQLTHGHSPDGAAASLQRMGAARQRRKAAFFD